MNFCRAAKVVDIPVSERYHSLRRRVISLPEWITVKSASRKVGVSDRTIRNWIAKGKLSAKKKGNRWLIDESSLSEGGEETGKNISEEVGRSETISVPLERYEALITRLAQLEAENEQFRRLLEDKRRPFWRRIFIRGG